MNDVLDFQKPIKELENKIKEFENISSSSSMDLTSEIKILKDKMNKMKKDLYSNLTPWQKVKIARLQQRPSTLDYVNNMIDNFVELHGDRCHGDDSSIIGGIGFIDNIPVTVVGHQKGKDTKENIKRNFGMPTPEGYRKALRLMRQAEKFNRPIISFIDTPGAYCGINAEERGQGEAIARNLIEMSNLKTPIICIVIGEGGSGGALALSIGDRICMLEHAIYSVISPEGLASILWKDSKLSKDAASIMKLTADDLYELEIVDDVIKEPIGGAHKDIQLVSNRVKTYVIKELDKLNKLSIEELLQKRYDKYRTIGIWQ